MATETMVKALNKQIEEELNSAYIYLGIAAGMESLNLPGAAAWYKKQFREEQGHGLKIWNYLSDIGQNITLESLPQPSTAYRSLESAFEATLAHEKHITACIHDLVRQARKENDIATENFLQWFVSEQVEEEKTAMDLLNRIKMVGGSPNGIYLLDRDLGKLAAS